MNLPAAQFRCTAGRAKQSAPINLHSRPCRCGGQLLMVDVGLSRAIAGEMAVLTCSNGVLRAVYGEGQEQEL